MSDLESFFRLLVDNLIAIDPTRLHQPIAITEIFETVVPYRVSKRTLRLDTSEDFEMVLLRLCSGEDGYFVTDPLEAQDRFAEEARSLSPDFEILRAMGDVTVRLGTERLAHALGPRAEEAYAPPEPAPVLPVAPPRPKWAPLDPELEEEAPAPDPTPRSIRGSEGPGRCGFCGGALPVGRTVKFCPHCGQSQVSTRCPECQSELDLGWLYCITCGHGLEDDG